MVQHYVWFFYEMHALALPLALFNSDMLTELTHPLDCFLIPKTSINDHEQLEQGCPKL